MSENKSCNIAVLGAGSWGTAIANHLAQKNYAVMLWAREKEIKQSISEQHENQLFHPGIKLSKNLQASDDLAAVLSQAQIVVLAIPTQYIRTTLKPYLALIKKDIPWVSISKGIEIETLKTVTGILKEITALPEPSLAVLSGPSFASEVIRGFPTAVTLACCDEEQAKKLQTVFHTTNFRPYVSTDPLGVELGGAIKNVIAIGAGIIDGLGYGYNAKAAFITRSLAEMIRLATAMGAQAQTLSGLSGVGDLILTCTSKLSRNHSLGMKLGQGEPLENILKSSAMVVEGVETAKAIHQLASRYQAETPIAEQVYQVLHKNKSPKQAAHDLLARDLKMEFY